MRRHRGHCRVGEPTNAPTHGRVSPDCPGPRLHRKLFVWFGVAIALSVGTVASTFYMFGANNPRTWRSEVQRVEHFVSGHFARVWSDPPAREELARSISRDLGLPVRLSDAGGNSIVALDVPRHCHNWRPVAVHQGATRLGTLEVCLDSHFGPSRPWRLPLALLAVGALLWAMSNAVARRISRPITELTRVARELGSGNLASRARLRHGHTGEVGELTVAVNEMASRIERQMRDQRELLAAVSHEIRTPLTRIRLLLELAREGGDGPRNLTEIDSEVIEIDALVGDLLASARMDFSALAPRPLQADEIARRAVERSSIPGVSVEVRDAPGSLEADATLVSRALAALLDNARKYGGDRVVLRVQSEGDRVTFAVDDDGHGFEAGDEERVFEAFYRGNGRAAQNEPRGIGLGLALVRRIAEAHGGRAYARNLATGGARVAIELPREPIANGSGATAH